MAPTVMFEDEHLLVVHKPAGWNTHAPGPHAGEGIYDWLRQRELRWATLAILHRLDKETSGVMVFGKTPVANRSLTEQFTERQVRKKYFLLTDRLVPQREFTVKTMLVRVGDKYMSRPPHAGAEIAETRFKIVPKLQTPNSKLWKPSLLPGKHTRFGFTPRKTDSPFSATPFTAAPRQRGCSCTRRTFRLRILYRENR